MNLTEDQKKKFKRKIEGERKVRILLELFGQGLFSQDPRRCGYLSVIG